MSSVVLPTMASVKMLKETTDFIGAPAVYRAGSTSRDQIEFLKLVPGWLSSMDAVAGTAGVELDAWADYTLEGLLKKVPSDLNIELRDFRDLGVVSRQRISTSWKIKGKRTRQNGSPFYAGDFKGIKLEAMDIREPKPAIEAFVAGKNFQSPVFKIRVVEGGHIYVAQHNSVLNDWNLYSAASEMVSTGSEQVWVDSLTMPLTDIEIRTDIPWMTGIMISGGRLDFAHVYAHLTIDENGSHDVMEVQGGWSLSINTGDFVIRGPMIYIREIEGQIVSLYHLDTDAYTK